MSRVVQTTWSVRYARNRAKWPPHSVHRDCHAASIPAMLLLLLRSSVVLRAFRVDCSTLGFGVRVFFQYMRLYLTHLILCDSPVPPAPWSGGQSVAENPPSLETVFVPHRHHQRPMGPTPSSSYKPNRYLPPGPASSSSTSSTAPSSHVELAICCTSNLDMTRCRVYLCMQAQ